MTETCWRCHKPAEDDSDLCESCDEESQHCAICDEQFWGDEPDCRHCATIDGDDDYVLFGCGSSEVPDSCHREPLFDFLEMLENYRPGIVREIRGPIERCELTTLLFGFDSLSFEHHPKAGSKYLVLPSVSSIDIREFATGDWEIGFVWIQSLDIEGTEAANELTVQWIDEWLSARALIPQWEFA